MIRVINNSIYLTRGDTGTLHLEITDDDGKVYTPSEGDELTFTLKKDPTETTSLLQKTITNNLLEIKPEETESLDYGRYCYDIQLKKSDGTVETIIPLHIFKATKEVTF